MKNDKVLELLDNANWNDIILKLTRYAIWRAGYYTWKPRKSDQLLKGKTPADIACEAIKKVYNGTRRWDPDKYPDLLKHLMRIVDSDMGHLYYLLEHKKTGSLPKKSSEDNSPTDFNDIPSDPYSPIHSHFPTPEENLISCEEKDLEDKLKKELYNLVKGDEDLEMLLLCFEEGFDKPEKIAFETGWEISKVYNLKRKLKRKAEKINQIFLKGDEYEER